MALQYIDVQRIYEHTDTASLSLSNKRPDMLEIVGGLNHGTKISFDAKNAQKMIDWLQQFVEDGA